MAIQNAGRLGQDQLLRHLIQDGPYNMQFMQVLPWYAVEGKQLEIVTTPRFTALPSVPVAAGAGLAETQRNPNAPKIRTIVDFIYRYDLNFSDIDNVEDPNLLVAEQDAAGIYSLMAGYATAIDVGTGDPGFPPLHTLTSQIVALSAALPTLEDFNRALLQVRTDDGYDVVVMGNLDALNTYWHACYERGVNPNFWPRQVPAAMGGTVERPTAWVQHARWYVNELIPTRMVEVEPGQEVPVSNIYFMQLGYNPDYGTSKCLSGNLMRGGVASIRSS